MCNLSPVYCVGNYIWLANILDLLGAKLLTNLFTKLLKL